MAKFIDDLNSGKLHFEYHFGSEDQDLTESDEEVVTDPIAVDGKGLAKEEVSNDIEEEIVSNYLILVKMC